MTDCFDSFSLRSVVALLQHRPITSLASFLLLLLPPETSAFVFCIHRKELCFIQIYNLQPTTTRISHPSITMRILFVASSFLLTAPAWGFSPAAFAPRSSSVLKPIRVAASDADITDVAINLDMSAAIAKEELLELVEELKAKYGILLIDSKAQESFKEAVEKLEETAEPPTDTSLLTGDWTLLCSTTTSKQGISGIDTSRLPFFNQGPFKDIRDTINQSLKVEQKIMSGTESDGVDSIDHVIDYKPPNKLSAVLKSLPDNLPEAIKDLNINPLQVSDTKVVLKHKAEIESVIPVIKTKLVLSSIVGESL